MSGLFVEAETIKRRWREIDYATQGGAYGSYDAIVEAICEAVNKRIEQILNNASTELLERASVLLAERVIERERAKP